MIYDDKRYVKLIDAELILDISDFQDADGYSM